MSAGTDINSTPQKFRWPRFSLAALFVVLTLAAVMSYFCGLTLREVSGKNLSGKEANGKLQYVGSPVRVPASATSVNIYASHFQTVASFDVTATQYREYCLQNGWPVYEVEWAIALKDLDGTTHTIEDGYFFDGSSDRAGYYDLYFDARQQRAWVIYEVR